MEEHDFKRAHRVKAGFRLDAPGEREIPHSLEAEQGVLGCLMLSPSQCTEECLAAFKGAGSDVFYDLRHRLIYEAFITLYERSRLADLIALQEELRKRNQIAGVGGVAYLASLPDAVPSAANLRHYLDIVIEKFIRRRLVVMCGEIVERTYEHNGELPELLGELERDFLTVGNLLIDSAGEKTMLNTAINHQQALEEGWANHFLGLSTGFRDLDEKILGMRAGQVITIGAASSDGKSTLVGNILAHNLRQGIPCGLFTLEMDAEEMFGRFASDESGVPLVRAQKGMHEEQLAAYSKACKTVKDWPLRMDDEGGITIAQIHRRSRRWVKDGVKLIAIDYAQLVKAGLKGTPNRTNEVGHVTAGVKAMARELKVAVLLLSS